MSNDEATTGVTPLSKQVRPTVLLVPVLLLPGESAKVTLVYRVTDCGHVPVEPWPVPVVAGTWRGESTVHLAQGRQQRRDDLPEPEGPQVEWQEGLAAKNCALTGRS
ncbi:hypothetical protein ACFQZ4_08145 [Catellatospora coxensis]|uniref:Uncharacterized protein n=1 Tax=Catellatospora coxensis TaxID=310354 RepID=A0A8J3PAL1_9ACTN|nr:hypothetical protein [Catellatospora coxensis]GIG09679.1 hypothetical protein Cco03nite_63790 [Catellatospora coxensis]